MDCYPIVCAAASRTKPVHPPAAATSLLRSVTDRHLAPVQSPDCNRTAVISQSWWQRPLRSWPAANFPAVRDNGFAMIVPAIFVNPGQLQANVQSAAQSLGADVAHINFDVGSDVMGCDSIFFKIVLTDEASHPARLRFVAQHVSLTLMNQLRTDENGVHAYFNFRSQSEVASTTDPGWAYVTRQ